MWNILQGYLEFQLWCFQQNFVCLDNLTVTLLCLLVSLLCHCYLAPCPFYSVGLFNIRTLFSDWLFISNWHKHNHSPYPYILTTHTQFIFWNPLQDIRVSTRHTIVQLHRWIVNTLVIFCSCFFLFHASWDFYMWGKRDETVEIVLWRAFLCWCACQHYYCCCEMLDQKEQPW